MFKGVAIVFIGLLFAHQAMAGTVLFSEDFNDGNYSGWEAYRAGNHGAGTESWTTSGSYLQIKRTGAGGAGGEAGIRQDVDIAVDATTTVTFDIKAISSSVCCNTGGGNNEYPASIYLDMEDASGSGLYLRFAYTDDSGSNKSTANYFQQAVNAPRNVWMRDQQYTIADYWPAAVKITRIRMYGNGWDFDGHYDNLVIETQSSAVPVPLTLLAAAPLLLTVIARRKFTR